MEVWGRVGESRAQGQPLPAQSPLGRTWGAVLGIYQRTRFPPEREKITNHSYRTACLTQSPISSLFRPLEPVVSL